MADIDAIDEDQKWYSREGKSKKGLTKLMPSLSYARLESKEDSPLMHVPKPTLSAKSSSGMMRTSFLSTTSTETSSCRVLVSKTNAVQNIPTADKSRLITKRRERKKVQGLTIRKRRSAPELIGTSAILTYRPDELRPKPKRRSQGSVRPKKSHLRIVEEKPRSKSHDVDAVKPFTKQMVKQNTKKSILRTIPRKYKETSRLEPPERTRSRSYSPRYEMKTYSSLEEMISAKVAIFKSREKSDSKLSSIKSKTLKLATGTLKKAPVGRIFSGKKNNVLPPPGNPV